MVVGQATLQPGQQTLVYMDFMMHEGMGGKHLFEVDVKSNDPTHSITKLSVASDWQPN